MQSNRLDSKQGNTGEGLPCMVPGGNDTQAWRASEGRPFACASGLCFAPYPTENKMIASGYLKSLHFEPSRQIDQSATAIPTKTMTMIENITMSFFVVWNASRPRKVPSKPRQRIA